MKRDWLALIILIGLFSISAQNILALFGPTAPPPHGDSANMTRWLPFAPWLYGIGNVLYFNESNLNLTTTNSWWPILGPYLFNNSGVLDFNETLLNETINNLAGSNITDTHINSNGNYLYDNYTTMFFNESFLNNTIDARATFAGDTQKNASPPYLFNDTTTIYFNETLLNETIKAWIDLGSGFKTELYLGTNCTGIDSNKNRNLTSNITVDFVVVDNQYLHYTIDYLLVNKTITFLNNIWDDMHISVFSVGVGTGINASDGGNCSNTWWILNNYYLYNNSGVLTLNESLLNQTINNIASGDKKWNITGYVINDSGSLNINESLLNITINDISEVNNLWTSISTQLIPKLGYNNVNITGTYYGNNFSSNSPLRLQTSGITRFFIDDIIGNIGIGTEMPLSPLDIRDNNKVPGAGFVVQVHADDEFPFGFGYFNDIYNSTDYNKAFTYYLRNNGTFTQTAPLNQQFAIGSYTNIKFILNTNSLISKVPINITSGNDICIEGGNCLSNMGGGSQWPITEYIINDSGSLNVNELMLNTTIDERDTNTQWLFDNYYLYNNSGVLTLNESKLNETINVIDKYYLNTHWSITEYIINDSGSLNVNESMLNTTIDDKISSFDVWVNKSGDVDMSGVFLINNSGFGIFINSSCLVFGNLSNIGDCI